jgi:hypothetical protein
MPFRLKRLRARLRELGIGPLTIKKRGSPLETEQLARRLGLRGDATGTIVLTRVEGKPHVLIVEEVGPQTADDGPRTLGGRTVNAS